MAEDRKENGLNIVKFARLPVGSLEIAWCNLYRQTFLCKKLALYILVTRKG